MAIEKNLAASGVLYTDRRDFYIEPNKVAELYPASTPFTTMVSSYNVKTGLKDPIFKLFEHRNPWVDQRFRIETGATIAADNEADAVAPYAASGSTYHVGVGTALTSACVGWEVAVHAHDSVNNKPTGERKGVLLVTKFTSATSIEVKNVGTSSVTVANGDWFVVIGNAHGEGSESPASWSDELQVVWGSCQMFRTPLQVTNTLKKAVLRGETSELMRLRAQKMHEHKMQKERAFLFGGSAQNLGMATGETFADSTLTDDNGESVRTTMGIMEALLRYGASTGENQNIFSIAEATYSYNDFVDDMEKTFQYYPEDGIKTVFCGAGFLSYWSKLEQSSGLAKNSGWTIRLSDMKKDTLGFNYRILETPHGLLQLVHTPMLTKSVYNKYGIVVDKENLFHAIYESPQYRQNIKTDNAPEYQKDEYFSYEGLGINLIESHKLFKIV